MKLIGGAFLIGGSSSNIPYYCEKKFGSVPKLLKVENRSPKGDSDALRNKQF